MKPRVWEANLEPRVEQSLWEGTPIGNRYFARGETAEDALATINQNVYIVKGLRALCRCDDCGCGAGEVWRP